MFLEQFFDPACEVDLTLDSASLARDELARIQTQACRILVAAEIPRRLGGDATSDELALDKKRCKRVLHVLRQQLIAWSEKDANKIEFRPITEADRVEGASMIWADWWRDQQEYLTTRRLYIATWALKKPDTAFGKKAVTRLSNEISHTGYAMR